jgi:putative transposase
MPPIRPELLDELLKGYKKPEDLLGEDGLLQQLTKALVERALDGELTHHLGYEKHDSAGDNSGNSRNGTTPKTMKGKRGQVRLDVPRDRDSSFEPQLVRKGQTRFDGLDEKIISLYARGMTQREIQGHLEEIYGVEISPSLISTVTDAVLDEVRAWQSRPLDSVYPILYLDALQVKVSQGRVRNKAIYLAFGVNLQGLKEVLGMWASDNEGAKFWMQVVTELKNRGVSDIFIACVDGLKGFPEAIEAIYPRTQVQLCMVHTVRHSLSYVSHKDRKAVAEGLKEVYQAASVEEAERQLARFEEAWAVSYPVIAKSWRQNWSRVVPMFGYPSEIRRAIYTTNTIESLNMMLRKVTKNRSLFPNDEAVFKLMYLAPRNISKRWTIPIKNWSGAMNQFAILFEGRVPMGGLSSNSLTQNPA